MHICMCNKNNKKEAMNLRRIIVQGVWRWGDMSRVGRRTWKEGSDVIIFQLKFLKNKYTFNKSIFYNIFF